MIGFWVDAWRSSDYQPCIKGCVAPVGRQASCMLGNMKLSADKFHFVR